MQVAARWMKPGIAQAFQAWNKTVEDSLLDTIHHLKLYNSV